MFSKKKEEPKTDTKMGGFGFFLTWISALTLASILSRVVPLFITPDWLRLKLFLVFIFIGAFVSQTFISGHISVLIHELKHSIISNFAGNKSKGMKINRDDGHFQYEYTKETAGHNAFITLAPYWLPLFTIPSLILCGILEQKYADLIPIVIGFAFGGDFFLAMRDAHPHQSDLIRIRGGLVVSYCFVFAMNLSLFLICLFFANYGIVPAFIFIKDTASELLVTQ